MSDILQSLKNIDDAFDKYNKEIKKEYLEEIIKEVDDAYDGEELLYGKWLKLKKKLRGE